MKIYYFGELIEVDGRKIEKQTRETEKQMRFELESSEKTGMESIGELLRDIDLSLDIYRPMKLNRTSL